MMTEAVTGPAVAAPPQAGFYWYRSSRAEVLASMLGSNLLDNLPIDPFAPFMVSVGSRGMERWLRQQLASGPLGIAANIEFPFPGDALAAALAPPSSQSAVHAAGWATDRLVWSILDILPSLLALPEFGELSGWLAHRPQRNAVGGVQQIVDRDQLALARELAQLFDRVSLFRPEWTSAWEQGSPVAGPALWQGALWRALRETVPGRPQAGCLAESTPQVGNSIHIFCVSSMPPAWIAAWQRVACVRPVHLYSLAPSHHYWGDTLMRSELRRAERARDVAGTELDATTEQNLVLAALGRLARDSADLLIEAGASETDVQWLPRLGKAFAEIAFPDPGDSTVLSALQSDILHIRTPAEVQIRQVDRVLSPHDDSFSVHPCHGPTRQVEALREVLLSLFDTHPTLEPRHVLVMAPDIGVFAPLIQAAFGEGGESGTTGAGGAKIPTTIHDLGVRVQNPMADALLRVLALVGGRLTASAFLEFCSIEPVRRRFALDDAAIADIRNWLVAAGARWGATAGERANSGSLAQHEFTFAFALDRLALGVVVPHHTYVDGSSATWQGCSPFDEAEGGQNTFGQLAEILARLETWRVRLAGPLSVGDWVERLLAALDDIAVPARKAGFLRAEVVATLETIRANAASFAPLLSIEAFSQLLTGQFDMSRGGDRPATGAVSVCALAPMRSVPFRVICLLGMDDGAFPRSVPSRGFDAVASHPARGDRDPREEDRNLLLEAILSARDHLLIFYTGFDPQTGRNLAPAVPVADLLDAVNTTFSPPTTGPNPSAAGVVPFLTYRHAVQPFSPAGFLAPPAWPAQPVPRRFDFRAWNAARQLLAARKPAPPLSQASDVFPDSEPPTSIALTELIDWTRRPVRSLVRTRIGLRPMFEQAELLDREALSVDSLEKWSLGTRLAGEWLRGVRNGDPLFAALLAAGLVPPGAPGRRIIRDQWADIAIASVGLPADQSVKRHRVDLQLGSTQLAGAIETRGGEILNFAPDDPAKPRRLLDTWVRLVVAAAGAPAIQRARIVGSKAHAAQQIVLQAPKDPMRVVESLVATLQTARTRVLPVLEKCSAAFAMAYIAEGDADSGLSAAEKAWYTSFSGSPGEDADPILAVVFPEGPPFADGAGVPNPEFADLALALWSPICAAMVEQA